MPRVGSEARVRHFGGPREHAVVCEVHDGGRRLRVDTEHGERLEFVLHPRTAKFELADSAHGATLELLAS
jgi:hypothetical protein